LTPITPSSPVFRAGVLQIAGILVGDTVDLDEFAPVGDGAPQNGRAGLSRGGFPRRLVAFMLRSW